MNPKYTLEKAYRSGEITRRDFLQRSALIGATVAVPGTLMSGAVQAEMKRGGVLRLGMGGGSTTDTIDSWHSYRLCRHRYRTPNAQLLD